LEGEKEHDSLLKFAINADNYHKSVILVTLDYSQPWNLVEELEKWLSVVERFLKAVQLPKGQKEKLQSACM
jgi:dynein light intermediate chain 1, cytosolic